MTERLLDLSSSRHEPAAPEYPAGVCGSCAWNRYTMMFGRLTHACVCMPPQVAVVQQREGAQIISTHPVINDPATDTCMMWKPTEENTQ